MPLVLKNSLTGRKDVFVPADPARVSMYVCGPTVYNFAHIGSARPAVVFDVLHRLLKRRFGGVVYARNVTDVDDKINEVAGLLRTRGLRVETDLRNEKIGYKVREHRLAKVPVLLVVGKREASETLSLREALVRPETEALRCIDAALRLPRSDLNAGETERAVQAAGG